MRYPVPSRSPATGALARSVALPQQAADPGDLPPFLTSLAHLDQRFEQFVDYAVNFKGHSPKSAKGYRSAYLDFRRFLLADAGRPLAERVFQVEAWVQFNRKRGLSAVSTNTFWRGLHSFFRDMHERDGIPDPFFGIKQPTLPTLIPKAKSPAECRRILDAARHYPWKTAFERVRAVAVIATFLYTGLRRSELLHLGFMDVDLSQGVIRVLGGKGRGGGRDRVVYVPPELKGYMHDYLRERQRCQLQSVEFFSSTIRGRGLSDPALKRIHAAVQRTSGVQFSIHGLRHSALSNALRAGVPLHAVRDMAGHSSVEITSRYLTAFDAEKREFANRVSFL